MDQTTQRSLEEAGTRVADLRHVPGVRQWTQQDLAIKAEVSLGTVQRIENGNDGRRPMRAAVAHALGVSVDEIDPKCEARWTRPIEQLKEKLRQGRQVINEFHERVEAAAEIVG